MSVNAQLVGEVALDDEGYPYIKWHGDESTFYDRFPVGTRFVVEQPAPLIRGDVRDGLVDEG